MLNQNTILVLADIFMTNLGRFADASSYKYGSKFNGEYDVKVSPDFVSAARAIEYIGPESKIILIDPELNFTGTHEQYPPDCNGQPGTSLLGLVKTFAPHAKVAYYTKLDPNAINGGIDNVNGVVMQGTYVEEHATVTQLINS